MHEYISSIKCKHHLILLHCTLLCVYFSVLGVVTIIASFNNLNHHSSLFPLLLLFPYTCKILICECQRRGTRLGLPRVHYLRLCNRQYAPLAGALGIFIIYTADSIIALHVVASSPRPIFANFTVAFSVAKNFGLGTRLCM